MVELEILEVLVNEEGVVSFLFGMVVIFLGDVCKII